MHCKKCQLIESILTHRILVWYGNSSAAQKKALKRVRKSAQKITQLPALEDIYSSCCLRKTSCIQRTHPNQPINCLCACHKRTSVQTSTPPITDKINNRIKKNVFDQINHLFSEVGKYTHSIPLNNTNKQMLSTLAPI
ncbi:hypothetical protein F2P81_020809 [Scophthalmus maximus]|uniref:Uncharacterized protein n=1 Tax=Scophthalmus maximus TaxID=52904 RepID=A0A6A4S416_SCOMX|nr:hypothetical protein F2P81_020809 [Scophthalmus maximus]